MADDDDIIYNMSCGAVCGKILKIYTFCIYIIHIQYTYPIYERWSSLIARRNCIFSLLLRFYGVDKDCMKFMCMIQRRTFFFLKTEIYIIFKWTIFSINI